MSENKKYNVAIAGATGAVGGAMLDVLERRDFPIAELRLLASERSVGKKLIFKGVEANDYCIFDCPKCGRRLIQTGYKHE